MAESSFTFFLYQLSSLLSKRSPPLRSSTPILASATSRPIISDSLTCIVTFTLQDPLRFTLQFSEGALDTVCAACQHALDALDEKLFGKGDAETLPGTTDSRSRTLTARTGTVTTLKTGKLGVGAAGQSKRPGQESDGERFSYAITAARRSEQRKLLNFIRLADYMLCGSLHALLIDSIQEILARMTPEVLEGLGEAASGGEEMQVDGGEGLEDGSKKESVPLFMVEVVLEDDQLVFEPSQIAFQTKVRNGRI